MTMTDDVRLWVRSAETGDADAIASIHVGVWRHGYRGHVPDAFLDALSIEARRQWWSDTLRSGRSTTLVAEDGGALLGWINLGPDRARMTAPGTCEVHAFFVAPEYRARGTARVLWTLARRFLRDAGFRAATLWVLAADAGARAAYEHLGWRAEPGAARSIRLGGANLVEVRYRVGLE